MAMVRVRNSLGVRRRSTYLALMYWIVDVVKVLTSHSELPIWRVPRSA